MGIEANKKAFEFLYKLKEKLKQKRRLKKQQKTSSDKVKKIPTLQQAKIILDGYKFGK